MTYILTWNILPLNIVYPYSIFIGRFTIAKDTDLDFFVLANIEGGYKFIVSDALRSRIRVEKSTGIEFRPYRIKLNEWRAPAGGGNRFMESRKKSGPKWGTEIFLQQMVWMPGY
jgi:hypothetical protein